MEPQKSIGIRKQAGSKQAREVKEEVVASQDDTPQQHPTPGGSAEPTQHRTEQAAEESARLSDASETIVSGDHAAGTDTDAAADGGAAGTVDAAGSSGSRGSESGRTDAGLDHDDWEAAFAEAAGTGSANVVPGGHPSLAQRSTLPMRRASTMPKVSGYEDLTDEERERAGHIDAEVPSVADSDASPKTTPISTGAGASGLLGTGASEPETPQAQESDANAATNQDAALLDHTPGAAGVEAGAAGTGASAAADARVTETDRPATEGVATEAVATEVAATETLATEPAATETAAANSAGNKTATDTAVITAAGAAGTGATAGAAAGTGAGVNTTSATEGRPADDEISEEEIRRRAEERERAGAAKPVLARILQVMIAVFFPVMLLAAAIRAVATPLFLWIEYHRPGFPADSYGFTTDDRMTFGSYAVDYLLNFSGSRYLGDLVTASGEPLYLESEVSHMADVKTVLTVAFVTALAMAVLSVLACIYLAKRSPGGIRRALFSGSVVTLVLVGALIVTAVLGWESFFTQVHTIFFANGNWTFRMDDTLIRLFPAQFWMDAGIAIAGLVLLTCIVVLIAAWPTKARRERSRRKQEEARRRYLDSLEAV